MPSKPQLQYMPDLTLLDRLQMWRCSFIGTSCAWAALGNCHSSALVRLESPPPGFLLLGFWEAEVF